MFQVTPNYMENEIESLQDITLRIARINQQLLNVAYGLERMESLSEEEAFLRRISGNLEESEFLLRDLYAAGRLILIRYRNCENVILEYLEDEAIVNQSMEFETVMLDSRNEWSNLFWFMQEDDK